MWLTKYVIIYYRIYVLINVEHIDDLRCLVYMAIIDGVLHPHEEIFIRNLDRFKEVSDEEFDIVRKKCLRISEIEIKEIIERIKDKNK